jgi:hypothetical protein
MSDKFVPMHHPQAASQLFEEQIVIVLADSGQVMVLNDTGALVWQLSDGQHSLEQICQAVVAEFEVDEETARKDIQALIDQLLEAQALVFEEVPA